MIGYVVNGGNVCEVEYGHIAKVGEYIVAEYKDGRQRLHLKSEIYKTYDEAERKKESRK